MTPGQPEFTTMRRDIYQEVTARILQELERGAAPWVRDWAATPGANVPCNAVTNRPYSGCNVMLLWLARGRGWATPRFLTYKQASEAGGHVRKGEQGSTVFFVKKLLVKDRGADAGEDDTKVIPMLRAYTVFNVAQCDGLPDRVMTLGEVKPRQVDERDATIDEFLAATGATISEGASEAYYRPGADLVVLPAFGAFKTAAGFYATAFHELAHWTGAKSRLGRDFGGRFGSQAYAAEELVAELTAAMLCAEFDLTGELRHAGYIANWITLLKSDARAFFTAASKAQAAADYLRGLALADAAPAPAIAA
jgi:antirestriction protein ArdC